MRQVFVREGLRNPRATVDIFSSSSVFSTRLTNGRLSAHRINFQSKFSMKERKKDGKKKRRHNLISSKVYTYVYIYKTRSILIDREKKFVSKRIYKIQNSNFHPNYSTVYFNEA